MRMAVEKSRQFMLEPAGLDCAIHPAFLGCACLPPPSPRTSVFARSGRARAWCASDGRITLVVERVVGNVVGADVVPDFVVGPIRKRRQLHDPAVVVVDFDLADIRARRPLFAPEPRYPSVVIHQRTPQRQHLPHLAADQPQIDVPIEKVVAMLRHHLADDVMVGQENVGSDSVLVANLVDQVIGFLRLASGIDCENADSRIDSPCHVDEHAALGLEARTDPELTAEFLDRPGQHLLCFHPKLPACLRTYALASTPSADGPRPIAINASSGMRTQNFVNDSLARRFPRYPAKRRATVSSTCAEGTRRKIGFPIAASRPSPPRRIMSKASSGSPLGPRPVVPCNPISPVQ